MRSTLQNPAGRQTTMGELPSGRKPTIPSVRPTGDAELEETFVRAAAAWARWRERLLWEGR